MNSIAASKADIKPKASQVHRTDRVLFARLLGYNRLSRLSIRFYESNKTFHLDEQVTKEVQRLLDPECDFLIEIEKDGTVKPQLLKASLGLAENGWRTSLVKVINRSGVGAKLRAESPNALPIPNGPADEISKRWLELRLFAGRPMTANLSGLGLEYRIMQPYASQPGEKTATIEFNVSGFPNKSSPIIRQWRFAKSTDGWGKPNSCTIEARQDALHIEQTGADPYVSAPVKARGAQMRLKWWGRAAEDGIAQVFWWTKELPQPDGSRLANIQVFKDREQEYSAEFLVEGELAGVRIDPNGGPGSTRIDWIDLEYASGEGLEWTNLAVPCKVAASHVVHFNVTDYDGTPCMASFEIRDSSGRVYPSQTKRQSPDMFFQTQIYRETGETIRLPNGTYRVRCNHGPESNTEIKQLVVDGKPSALDYRVSRWIDTSKQGYWSSDHHIHAAGCLHYENPTQGILPIDMLRHIMGEDVKVGCCLTWGPCFDFQKQFFKGRPDDVSRYPYLLRYDIEVSGFGSHVSGHLNLLKLKQQLPPGGNSKSHWPTLGLNTLRWAKGQGAVTGNKVPAIDFLATMNTPRAQEWNIWYHALNCGFPVVVSGETDFPCMSGERVGIGRVYVKLDGRLEYDAWVEAPISIENQAGVTSSIRLESEQFVDERLGESRMRWLRIELVPDTPLTGASWEHRKLRIWSRDQGVRAAAISVNVGQGTQDLGFRGELAQTFLVR